MVRHLINPGALMMSSEDIDAVTKEVVKGILAAHEELTRLTGKPLPANLVKEVLRETLHIAVHELAHAALRASYPEFERLVHEGDLGECVDEVTARILELVVSERLGLATHSIDEHVYELKHYISLANLPISAEGLRKLYEEAMKLLRTRNLDDAINLVLAKCREWIRVKPSK